MNRLRHCEPMYHRLRDSASPVLTATGLVNGKWQFSTPTEFACMYVCMYARTTVAMSHN